MLNYQKWLAVRLQSLPGSRLHDPPANEPVESEIFPGRGGEIHIIGNADGAMPP
jgi:hypothetical protein